MSSSGMLCRAALVRTDVSGEHLRSVIRLLVTANVAPSSPSLFTLMMKVIHSSETTVLTRATRSKFPEDGILHTHRRGNLKSYSKTHLLCRISHLGP
jgi:hypothetical protein